MIMIIRCIITHLFILSLLSGCIGPGGFGVGGYDSPINSSATDPKIPTAQLNQMHRFELRQKLGVPPIISSSYWGFDLFRMDVEHDTSMLLTWFGLPITGVPVDSSKDHSRYTLVAYDQSGQGRFLQSGIVLNPTWNSSSLISDYSKLYLRVGEVLFFIDKDWNQGVNLLVTPVARDFYVSHVRSADQCMVMLGCGDRSCPNQLTVDETLSGKLPLRLALPYLYYARETTQESWLKDVDPFSTNPWFATLYAMELLQGDHVLKFSAKQIDGTGYVKLSCQAGTVSYVVINPTVSGQKFVDWQIEVTDIMPVQFSKRPLLLVSDDKWYVNQEPDR